VSLIISCSSTLEVSWKQDSECWQCGTGLENHYAMIVVVTSQTFPNYKNLS